MFLLQHFSQPKAICFDARSNDSLSRLVRKVAWMHCLPYTLDFPKYGFGFPVVSVKGFSFEEDRPVHLWVWTGNFPADQWVFCIRVPCTYHKKEAWQLHRSSADLALY